MVINSDNQVSELIFGAFGDFLTQSGTLGVFAIFAIPSHPGCRGEHQMVINSDNQINDSIIIANVWLLLTKSGIFGGFCHFGYYFESFLGL